MLVHSANPFNGELPPISLIAFKMNGEDLPAAHGLPVRLIVPGWIGSAMQKGLNQRFRGVSPRKAR